MSLIKQIKQKVAIQNFVGQFHCATGPAIVWEDGSQYWYLYNRLHRNDGPAIELPTGHKEWWFNGQRHRLNGPAIERPNGSKEYWIHNQCILIEKDYWTEIYEMGLITKEELFLKLL